MLVPSGRLWRAREFSVSGTSFLQVKPRNVLAMFITSYCIAQTYYIANFMEALGMNNLEPAVQSRVVCTKPSQTKSGAGKNLSLPSEDLSFDDKRWPPRIQVYTAVNIACVNEPEVGAANKDPRYSVPKPIIQTSYH
jgi:hypothetical protein